ncbi:MAG: TonB-dependent receptor [Gammaproteobacteria bacterium]
MAGRSLISVITEIEAAGLEVYYSSDLVRPWMTVKTEPGPVEGRDLLEEIIKPYGLTLESGPQDSVLIVRKAEEASPETGSILGVVRESGTGRRVGGATVALDAGTEKALTSTRGHFSFRGLTPGWHTVRILQDETGTTAATASVEVEPGRISVVQLSLDTPDVWQLGSVVVNASRYDLAQRGVTSSFFLPVDQIEQLPDLGDDPLRSIARLPGAATNGWSAKSHLRGGDIDENLVLFDGMRLRNPFHLKDFQSVFSAIDPAIIRGMDVYTGSAPIVFGDRMSGVIDIHSLEPPVGREHEISQSLFNSSVMTAGSSDDGRVDWAVSARRGNLDLVLDVIDPDIGDPSYFDIYTRFGVQATNTLRVTGNVLFFDDDISLSDTDSEEEADASYRDVYYWVRLDHEPTPDLRGWTILSHTYISSNRKGTVEKDGISTGSLDDDRTFNIEGLESNWRLRVNDRLQLGAGGGLAWSEGDYDYTDEAVFDLLFLTPGAPTEPARNRDFNLDRDGGNYWLYGESRWRLTDALTAELGLRWDRQTLTENDEDLLSPRVGMVYDVGENTTLRAGWGRHYQTQGIDELQISDGVTRFFDAQRADHLVASIERRQLWGMDLRLEAYRKEFDRLRPRFENLLYNRVLLPELTPDRIQVAPDDATAYGVEASLVGRHRGPLGWWLSYSWSRVEDRLFGEDIPRAWDQREAYSGGFNWDSGGWNVSLAGSYRSGWPTTEVELIQSQPIGLVATGRRNDENLSDYFTIDARIAREFRLPNSTLIAFLEVTNVFDRNNDCCVEYELEEDEEGLLPPDLALQTRDYLPTLPSIGFTWRF